MNQLQNWSNFFVTTAEVAAALTGLIFVGVSISLARILEIPTLPGRALDALVTLLAIVVISLLTLVPGQSLTVLGVEWLIIGIAVWAIVLYSDTTMFKRTDQQYKKHYRANIFMGQIVTVPYLIAGIMLITGNSAGVYWIVPGFIFSLIKSLLDAWVLVIEINR